MPVSLPFFTPSMQVGARQTMVAPLQTPLAQSLEAVQPIPGGHPGQVPPPQSAPVSLPFFTPSMQVGAWQVPGVPLQTLSWQSLPALHFLPSPHRAQVSLPPQSTSVSLPSRTPSAQLAATHRPMPSHTLPVPSQAMPLLASVGTQAPPALHAGVAQTVPVAGQSSSARQARHLPLPSQSLPPLSEQLVIGAALAVMHAPFEQVAVTHIVPVAVQWQSPHPNVQGTGAFVQMPTIVAVVGAPPALPTAPMTT
jgi:hypothetical protein